MGGRRMGKVTEEQLNEAISNFRYEGLLVSAGVYGNGHINDTYLLKFATEKKGEFKVILQRINTLVFKNPVELMENIEGVTSYLREKILEEGGDPERETLNIIPTRDGYSYYVDSSGDYWRSYVFIAGATSYDLAKRPGDFYESAVAFGHFQYLMADYPAETLYETIRGFHDTKARYATFQEAVRKDVMGRACQVETEIRFVLEREDLAYYLGDLQAKGGIPIRVTHNDTKLNNVLLDDKTEKALCVIDLDTVMPGLAVNDFGDSIRFGASTALEDEQDLSKVSLNMELFEMYTRGFAKGCGGRLTGTEIRNLAIGAKVMTYECGMRFLTDYLQGDIYFKIHRNGHNLDRCRTQFTLVRDMEKKWDEMNRIVADVFRSF